MQRTWHTQTPKTFIDQTVPAAALPLPELNALRRRAVQLRVDGHSLTRIQDATGLSVPTIIKACKAFETGGWQAIEVQQRGRPRGAGRALDPAQEAALRQAALQQPPEAAGLAPGLWDVAALQALAQGRWGLALEARAVSRLLERWGVALRSVAESAPPQGPAAAWATAEWPRLLAEARGTGRHLPSAGTPAPPVRIRCRGVWWVAQPPTMTGASSSWMNSLRFSGSLSDEDTCSAETVVPRMTTMSAPACEAMGASRPAPWGDVATATVTPAARRSVMRALTSSESTGRAA